MLYLALATTALLVPGPKFSNHLVEQGDSSACTRRALLWRAGCCSIPAALATLSAPAHAGYGEAAQQAAPALIPSPFYPSGPMADTCIQVALGREDVCITPKKLISSYEGMQLDKQLEDLTDPRPSLDPEILMVLESTAKMIPMLKKNDFTGIELELSKVALSEAQIRASGKDTKAIQSAIDSLSKEFKRPRPELEPGKFAPILVRLARSAISLADSS
jgi:hypothetical protein